MSQEQGRQQRSSFSVDSILSDSRQTMGQIKEASAQKEERTKQAGALQDAEFGAILDTLTGEKTASDAVRELTQDELRNVLAEKVAELAGVNQSALIKEAQLIGSAVYDGYLARASEAEYHATKVAQVMNLEDPDLEKIAEDIGFNEGAKVAMAIAEQEIAAGAMAGEEKLAYLKEASYQAGHVDTLSWLSGFDR